MRRILFLLGMVLSIVLLAAPVRAQDFREEGAENVLLEDLRRLIEQGEQEHLADRRFLDALDMLVRRHGGGPGGGVLFRDTFQDGNFTRNPSWIVASGDFWVEGGALRSEVSLSDERSPGGMDQLPDIIGTLLDGRSHQDGRSRHEDHSSRRSRFLPVFTPAEIHVRRFLPSAFVIRLRLDSRSEQGGQFEFGPYQGLGREAGYRLVYTPDRSPALSLVRVTSRASQIIGVYDARLDLDDGRFHDIVWSRAANGFMRVTLDGRPVIRTSDQGFERGFQGLALVNGGGAYGIDAVTVEAR